MTVTKMCAHLSRLKKEITHRQELSRGAKCYSFIILHEVSISKVGRYQSPYEVAGCVG